MRIPSPYLDFDHAAIVVAHPDDEILWFSSILKKVDRIVVCYLNVKSNPAWSDGRRRSLSEYPLKNIRNLEMDESEIFDDANWLDVDPVHYGVRIKKSDGAHAAYKRNFNVIQERLRSVLAGCKEVFTHNPWGEYGNEEHVQVFKAVERLQGEHGYNLWHTNYCSNKSLRLMTKHISEKNFEYFTLKTDETIGEMIEGIYKKNGCWTWYNDWKCFKEESFIKHDHTDIPYQYGHNFPLNLINVEISYEQHKNESFRHRFCNKIKRNLGINRKNI